MSMLQSSDHQSKQIGVAIYCIDKLSLRTGSEPDESDLFGVLSLQLKHVSLDTPGVSTLQVLPSKGDVVAFAEINNSG